MSEISDALHEAAVSTATPFVGSIGADILGSALDLLGALVTGNWDEE